MRIAVFALAATVSGVLAQDDPASTLPDCSIPCVSKFTEGSEIAGCEQAQYKCVCSNEDFLANIACCLEDSCDEKGKKDAIQLAGRLCGAAGVQVPDSLDGLCPTSSGGNSTDSDGDSSSGGGDSDGDSGGDSDSDSASGGSSSTDSSGDDGSSDQGGSGAGIVGPSVAVLMAGLLAAAL